MEIALGTVQFGLPYGIAGRGESVPPAEARRILEIAHAAGIRVLDTAAVYGDIEERLGALCEGLEFGIVSKVPPVPPDADAAGASRWVRDSIERSRARLGSLLTTILFHRAADLREQRSQAIWESARAATEAGDLRLGVSCYGPDELQELRGQFPIPVTQLPGNALDQRVAVAADAGDLVNVEVHMRSAFLQGLLLMSSSQEVAKRLPAATSAVERWQKWCAERELRPLQAALAVAKGTPGVRSVVLGVDRPAQIEEILQAWDAVPPLRAPELACTDLAVIDPRRWSPA